MLRAMGKLCVASSLSLRLLVLSSSSQPCQPFQFLRNIPHMISTRLRASSSSSSTSTTPSFDSRFLDSVDVSVDKVLQKYSDRDILTIPECDRESVGVARNLRARLASLSRSNDCRRCWLQRAHCVCKECPPIPEPLPRINRLFLLTHHKEICLVVDTAKLILAAYPEQCRLVVGGIHEQFQDSMLEMKEALGGDNCFVLFPSDDATSFPTMIENKSVSETVSWDVVVLDGTWEQAKRLHNRYIVNGPECRPKQVELSSESVAILASNDEGHQMRRHAESWRQVSTLEATRLLLRDMNQDTFSADNAWEALATYQRIADAAARTQLGPPRISS